MALLNLRIEVATDPSSLTIRDEWAPLAGEVAETLPTMLAGFLVPWYEHAAPDYRCHALTAWQGKTLFGVAPLALRTVGRFGITCRILSFPMRGTTPPFDILTGGRDEAVATALVDHLARVGGWDMILLHNVRTPSRAVDALCQSARLAGFDVDRTTCAETYFVETDRSWDEFLRKRPRNIRKNTWRNWRNCEEIGVTKCIAYPGDIADLDQALRYVERLLPKSWKSIDGVNSLDDHFLGRLARALDGTGRLVLRFLTIGDKPVSYLMEIHCRNDWYLFHSAFDPAYQRLSAGQLVIGECIRAAHEAGIATVDFFGGSDYMARWTERTRQVDEIMIVNPAPLSRLKTRLYRRINTSRRAAAHADTVARKEAFKKAGREDADDSD